MKNNIIILLFALLNLNLSSQIGIEKFSYEGSSILDFKAGTKKGIILPAVSALPLTPANGSFALFKTDGVVYMRENNNWIPLTTANGNLNGLSSLFVNASAEVSGGVTIGAPTSSAKGVLV